MSAANGCHLYFARRVTFLPCADNQIATEARRWSGVTQLAPSKPQLVRRSIDQPSDLALDLGQTSGLAAGCRARRRDRERATARQRAGELQRRSLGVSYSRPIGDAVDPAALFFGRGEGQPELLLQGPEKTPRTV
jgi:hypothetical protein